MRKAPYDIAIIGGGINGCGIARDAAGRGLSLFLCEKGDLAGGTSSASTKLIHGGLRYLEHHEFRLVRESLTEREVLLRAAPHIIWPLRFVLPYHGGLRPAWLIRAGLFLYDNIGGRKLLPGARRLDLAKDAAGRPLKPEFRSAFEYSDCWVEDSRLVVLNAMDAAKRGATIRVRAELVAARRERGVWILSLRDAESGVSDEVAARTLVNAAGPWVAEVASERLGLPVAAPVRLVKGSHIIVRRLFDHDRAYIFQNSDNRIVFAIPYEGKFTLIGTTDADYRGDPGDAAISEGEVEYLCAAASEYFRAPVSVTDIVRTYAGVRPLFDDGAGDAQSATRDYVLKLEGADGEPPLLNIYGGKITTYRRLAEAALEKLAPALPQAEGPWTAAAPLPGGDFPVDGFAAEVLAVQALCPSAKPAHARRLVRAYGTLARKIVQGVRTAADWGETFGADLTAREVRYLMEHEWARNAEDVLWRRSKLGLHMDQAEADRLDAWMQGESLGASARMPRASGGAS
ncbi:MAG: glycerol-3-phosphate dehydrogenase [Rhizobiales bacterium]|nr:glycerol-3-phosphate dehydrogenase [Hyphomicrobiales bacterium]